MLQSDVKLKRAEEANQQLADELGDLKKKYEALEPGSPIKKKKMTMDLLDDLSRVFDDDRTFVGGNIIGAGVDLFSSDIDPTEEYDFKVKLMEQDLQAIQNENNALVQTMLKLRQEFREKKNMHDEVSVKLINQEMAELRRDIKAADEKYLRLKEEIAEHHAQLDKMSTNSRRHIPFESVDSLKLTIDQLEQSNKVAIIQLCDLKDQNKHKQQHVDIERSKRAKDKALLLEQKEKDSLLVGDLRNKILDLTNEIRMMEAAKLKKDRDQSLLMKSETPKYSKDHLMSLRQTNERLMGEIIRLNGIIKEQKAAEMSRMNQSLSISAINFNEQSFDQSFLSKFK